MTSPTASKARPLSPHLQVYKPQISSAMSIFHRMTGVALAFGLPVFVIWLLSIAGGQQAYDDFASLAQTKIGQVLLFGWTWAFFYHFCCGVRHLIWDSGAFITKKGLYSTGYAALLVSTLSTIAVWLKIYGYLP